jgi:uncharacterized protein (DUF362 family)
MNNKNHHDKNENRRSFIKTGACAVAFTAMTPGCLLKQRVPGEPLNIKERNASAGLGPKPLPPTRVYPDMPDGLVSVVGVKDSIYNSVRESVIAAGGIDEIEAGQTVLIKPNMCGPAIGDKYPGRITTNPEVLRAVIQLVKERGAKVIVSDRSMIGTELAMQTSGFAKVCLEEGAKAFPWSRAKYVRFHPGKRHWSNGFRMPKILNEVDHFINVPLLKNHAGADITCCMKAFVGVAMPLDRHMEGPDAFHTKNIGEKIAELNLCAKPLINIVDATEIMVKGGPDGLKRDESIWEHPSLIMSSKDRVACDSVALAVLKRYGAENKVELPYVDQSVRDQPQLYYGAELGIGQCEPSRIKIEEINAPLFDEIKSNWI